MKKQALIVFGEYRTFETASKFWNIPDNFDIFISTWNLSIEKRCCWVEFDSTLNDWNIKSVPYFNPKNLDLIEFTSNPHEYFVEKDIKVNLEYREQVNNNLLSSLNPKAVRIHSSKKASKTHSTANMIYHWKHALDDVLSSNNWDLYENIFMTRIDCAYIPQYGYKSMFDFEKLYNLNDKTIYTSSPEDLSNGTFFNDVWVYGNKESMKTWIQYLDIEKHKESHRGLAIATKELVDKKILKHINPENEGLHIEFIRRGMVDMWEAYYKEYCKDLSLKHLPINHKKYSEFFNACNIQYQI